MQGGLGFSPEAAHFFLFLPSAPERRLRLSK